MFAVGRSTVSAILRDVVHAINDDLRGKISWPSADNIPSIVATFQDIFGLPGAVDAIDGTQIVITRPCFAAADYYYFKSGDYSINYQAVVDTSKRFMDIHVEMARSTNDAHMLQRSTLFHRGQHNILWPMHIHSTVLVRFCLVTPVTFFYPS